MTSSRPRIPIEEFVNESEDQQQIGSAIRVAARLTNMDVTQQKIACAIISGVALLSAILGFLCMFAIGQGNLAIMSRLNRNSLKDEQFITEEIFERIAVDSMKGYITWLTQTPHPGGQRRDDEIANWITQSFKAYRLDHVQEYPYEVLLSIPSGTNKIELIDQTRINLTASNSEPGVPSGTSGANQAFIAYSAKKDIEEVAPLFVNYATEDDFLKAKEIITDLKKIVIAKYGKISVAQKVKNAMKHEVKGMILYGDPQDVAESGTSSHNVYPNSWWLSGSGIIRDTATLRLGDPQTPGWPSLLAGDIHNAYGVYLEQNLPKIPVQPVSYDDARQILRSLGGQQDAPQGWSGGLGISYKLGGVPMEGSRKVRLVTTNELISTQVKNIVGTIRGAVEPDRYVIIGSHRDSWSYGAVDSAVATSAMIEIVGAFEETMKAYGWRPRRTLVFVSFGASNYGHIGAQEWVEHHMPKLKNRVVAYINLDAIVIGTSIDSTASIPLKKVILNAIRNVRDPMDPSNYERSYYDYWKETAAGGYMQPDQPFVNYLGNNGDYNPFAYQAGIPSMDIRFTNSQYNLSMLYPTHNTGYDTAQMYERILDPELKILRTCSQVIVHIIRELADSVLLPFDVMEYINALSQALDFASRFLSTQVPAPIGGASPGSIETFTRPNNVSFDNLRGAISEFTRQARNWTETINITDLGNPMTVRTLNDQMMQLEKIFLLPNGLPFQNTSNHAVLTFDGGKNYGQATFPGLMNLLQEFLKVPDQERNTWYGWELLRRHVTELYVIILQAASHLKPHHII